MVTVYVDVDLYWNPDGLRPGPRHPGNPHFKPAIALRKKLEVARVPPPGDEIELLSTSGERFTLEIASVYANVSMTILGSVFVERTKAAYLARIRSLVEGYGFDPSLLSKDEYFW